MFQAAYLNPPKTYFFGRVPLNSILGQKKRTYKKVGFGRFRSTNLSMLFADFLLIVLRCFHLFLLNSRLRFHALEP